MSKITKEYTYYSKAAYRLIELLNALSLCREDIVNGRPGGIVSATQINEVDSFVESWIKNKENIVKIERVTLNLVAVANSLQLTGKTKHGYRFPSPVVSSRQIKESNRFAIRWLNKHGKV